MYIWKLAAWAKIGTKLFECETFESCCDSRLSNLFGLSSASHSLLGLSIWLNFFFIDFVRSFINFKHLESEKTNLSITMSQQALPARIEPIHSACSSAAYHKCIQNLNTFANPDNLLTILNLRRPRSYLLIGKKSLWENKAKVRETYADQLLASTFFQAHVYFLL